MIKQVSITNRKASYDYTFIKEYVAGMQLLGTEVKQIRAGKISLADCYCYFENGELFVKGIHIAEIQKDVTHSPLRDRKLLLNKSELKKLERDLEPGMTIIVSKVFTNEKGFIKANVILAKGKKNYDKRSSIKENEIKREINRETNRN